MRLTSLLLAITCLHLSAASLSQTVTLNVSRQPIPKVLEAIESQTGYVVIYNDQYVKEDMLISLRVRNRPLEMVLDEMLKPRGLVYQIKEKIIAIKGEESADQLAQTSLLMTASQEFIVTGRVVDEKGEPLEGVTVVVKGTSVAGATDANGNYRISIPEGRNTLVFTIVGFGAEERNIGNLTTIDVAMTPTLSDLDEVVVVGYGTQVARNVTGSIERVSASDLGNQPVPHLGQMLQGKMSGIRVNQTTGRPGAGMKFQIRGAVSLTAGSDPLFVVDGMPVSGNIGDLNPEEIESISVLKDATAAALYGSRGANGVVLIQTKRGADAQTRIGLNSYVGYERVPDARRLQMMDAAQYAQFQKEIAELNGRPVHEAFQNPAAYGKGTDWFREVTRNGMVQSHNLHVSAGTDKFTTAVVTGYFKQEGVVLGTGYERLSFRANNQYQPNKRLKIGLNIAPTLSFNTNFNTDGGPYSTGNIISSALITTPLVSPYNADGSLAMTASDPATFGNPNWVRVAREITHEAKDFRMLSNLFVEYEVIDGLKLKSTGNLEIGNANLLRFNPSTIGTLFSPPPRVPSGEELNSRYVNWVNENSIEWAKDFGNHHVDVLGGFTAQKYTDNSITVTGNNFADDKVKTVSAANQLTATNSFQAWSILSFLMRVNYDYKSKYLFSASIRSDGSSRFGVDNRWGNFPSVSAGWVISEEDFWDSGLINHLKLRGSYGITGNFNIGNFTHLSTVAQVFYPNQQNAVLGRTLNNIGDRGLGWERNSQYNIGVDANLFSSRLKLTYNYYNRNSKDLLFNVQIPRSSGFSTIQTNIGELKFWGHEFSASSTIVNNNDFNWDADFNISFDRNRTISLATQDGALVHGLDLYGVFSHRTEVGKPIGMFFGAIQDGVYVNQQDFDNSPKHASSAVGTIKFKDISGDGEITFPDDMTLIGSPWPKFVYGLANNISYKALDLSFSIVGSYGNEVIAHHENWTTNLDGVFNVLAEVEDRWKSPEQPGAGKYGSTQEGTTFLERDTWHTRYVKDASYFSLRNVTLGYTLPVSRFKINQLRLYGSVQNALLLTAYPGPNPEVNTQASASGSVPGMDSNAYPVPRTFSIGVNLSF